MSILLPGVSQPDLPDEHPVYARSGWLIPQEKPDRIRSESMEIRARELMSWRRGLKLRSLSTYPYNCVGMIFASRRAWIEIDYIYDILRADEYRSIQRRDVMQGDVVLYKNQGEPSHVALIVMVELMRETPNIQVISKWGTDAEFIHYVENVPSQLGVPAEFYTERRDL